MSQSLEDVIYDRYSNTRPAASAYTNSRWWCPCDPLDDTLFLSPSPPAFSGFSSVSSLAPSSAAPQHQESLPAILTVPCATFPSSSVRTSVLSGSLSLLSHVSVFSEARHGAARHLWAGHLDLLNFVCAPLRTDILHTTHKKNP